MRILLTGTDGQVGGALQPLLANHGTIIAPLIAEFDLSKPETLAARLDSFKPDLIINPAAYTAVDRAEDERELAFLINAEGPEAIAQWAAEHRVPLVHFSTDYVFDGSGDKPWREDSPTNPLSVYGASKLAGDTAIRAAGGPHLIARTSWVYAATRRQLPAHDRAAGRRAQRAAHRRRPDRRADDGEGDRQRDHRHRAAASVRLE